MSKNYMNDVLKIAKSKIGVKETGNNNVEFNTWANKHTGGSWQGQPWCYTFVSFCMITAGLNIPFCASCPTGYSWYKNKGKIFDKPQVGDLAFFCWNKEGYAQHIGFVTKVNNDGSFTCIEGNTSPSNKSGSQDNGEGVYEKTRRLSDVKDFGRPNYIQ